MFLVLLIYLSTPIINLLFLYLFITHQGFLFYQKESLNFIQQSVQYLLYYYYIIILLNYKYLSILNRRYLLHTSQEIVEIIFILLDFNYNLKLLILHLNQDSLIYFYYTIIFLKKMVNLNFQDYFRHNIILLMENQKHIQSCFRYNLNI